MKMMLARRLLLVTLALSLSACFGSAPPVPKEQYFRLIANSTPATAAKPVDGVVEVPPLQAEGVMGERPLLFTKDGGQKLEQRNYAYWTDPPPAMLRDQIVAYLRTAKLAKDVVPSELRVQAQYRVEGRIKRLEQLSGAKNAAVIALELALIDKTTDSIVASGSYEVTKEASGPDIDDAVHALNAGLNEILAKFVADLGSAG
ncbi:ABC-type transport auxiliary lipoprotein family protein [Dongia rigui]|uniref:ABC-type transport auxiliary lipoprotein family protein n=1 Tax=Dongia rigui TaxID=940149 RepID=A0ABU5E351_9PROT|nr:ABC-type transport auxiliary lipoprotein family protein [Dongia rigui]MDY0873951.1 ABC-type transport auxiliary lipoprotein family protein [Dongia rigui]